MSLRLQHSIEHGAKRHRVYRLVQQMQATGSLIVRWPQAGVSADEEGRDDIGKCAAYLGNRLDSGLSVRQAEIRNDEIRRPLLTDEAAKRAAAGIGGDDRAA